MVDLSVIILTYNEQRHIARCIESVGAIAQQVYVVDSFSDDATVEIAEQLGAHCVAHPFENQAKQFNWGLEHLPIETGWIMRMDADEYVTAELAAEIKRRLPQLDPSTSGVYLKRRVLFMDRWIKHGGYYPTWLLRIFRTGSARYEQRWMDEHVKLLEGSSLRFEHDIIDDNLNNLGWWTAKHNNYATREAIDLLNQRFGFFDDDGVEPNLLGSQEQRKRWLKGRYAAMPLFVRPFAYFLYRYLLRAGFLDGQPGLIWHFLQGFWYRFLVDAKLYEILLRAGRDPNALLEYLRKEYGFEV